MTVIENTSISEIKSSVNEVMSGEFYKRESGTSSW